ncbi:MAG: rhomboid family intramembrane serine protease [Phycisphaerae bacterium]|nr:rhomboid family intramembrane serine protease [Phycisphaerae bacterium]
MFPIRDNNPTSTVPYMTIGLILINTVVFILQLSAPHGLNDPLIWKYGFVPAELVFSSSEFDAAMNQYPPVKPITDRYGRSAIDFRTGKPIVQKDVDAIKAAEAIPATINIVTCMFLHGGWMHLIGNMLFLWVFGNNVEDRLGPALYLIFYLATGVCGNLAHTFFEPSLMPLVGASGAISGVMGAYLLLFPRSRILAIVPIGYYPVTLNLPAFMYLGFYILLQNLFPAFRGSEGNVAYWAHIGGFAAGMALIAVLPKRPHHPRLVPAEDAGADDADFVL